MPTTRLIKSLSHCRVHGLPDFQRYAIGPDNYEDQATAVNLREIDALVMGQNFPEDLLQTGSVDRRLCIIVAYRAI